MFSPVNASVPVSLMRASCFALVATAISTASLFAQPMPTPLTLGETLHLVVTRNLQVESARTELDASRAAYRGEWGLYEPRLVVTYRKESDRRLNNAERARSLEDPLVQLGLGASGDPLRFYYSQNDRLSAGIEQALPTGGSIRVGSDLVHLRNNVQRRSVTIDTQQPIDREFESYAGVSLRQPLLKGAGFGTTMARIRVAASRSDQTFQEVRGRMTAILSQAEVAYWEVYRTRREQQFRAESVERAARLLADNRSRLDAGRMSSIDVAQAEAALALRQTQLGEAEQALELAVAQLRSFIGEEHETAFLAIDAVDALEFEPRETDFIESMRRAMALHPRINALGDEVDQAEIQRNVARNFRLPQLDLTASYGLNGYGLREESSYDNLGTGEYKSWFIGLELDIPLFTGLREKQDLLAARHRLRGAQATLDSTRIELSNVLRATTNAVRSLSTQVRQYTEVVRLNEAVLEGELSNLESGRGDSRDVLRAEESLTDARIALLRSLVNYQRRLIDLEALEGTYLGNRRMDLTEDDEA